MKSNTIVLLNYNNVLSENSRKSVISAAARWKVSYTEVTNINRSYLTPSWHKIEMLYDLIGYERVFLVDADILIRSDTPSPFNIYEDCLKFYAVKDILKKYDTNFASSVINHVQKPYFSLLSKEFDNVLTEDKYLSGFFNTGVCLFSVKNSMSMLNMFMNHIPTEDMVSINRPLFPRMDMYGCAHHEQALINYCSKVTLTVSYMDDEWNCIDPNTDSGIMDCYIYHFTGSRCSELKKIIGNYNWKVN